MGINNIIHDNIKKGVPILFGTKVHEKGTKRTFAVNGCNVKKSIH